MKLLIQKISVNTFANAPVLLSAWFSNELHLKIKTLQINKNETKKRLLKRASDMLFLILRVFLVHDYIQFENSVVLKDIFKRK